MSQSVDMNETSAVLKNKQVNGTQATQLNHITNQRENPVSSMSRDTSKDHSKQNPTKPTNPPKTTTITKTNTNNNLDFQELEGSLEHMSNNPIKTKEKIENTEKKQNRQQ